MAHLHRARKYLRNYEIDELIAKVDSEKITFKGSDPEKFEKGQEVVASFPGQHGKAWNLLSSGESLVQTTCVFLPDDDPKNGYGQHDPPNSENCHCMSLYNGKAKWGCLWYTLWMKKTKQAVSKGAKLIVVTKMGANDKFGKSQKGEVKFLENSGIPYKEMSIREFINYYARLVGRATVVEHAEELGRNIGGQFGCHLDVVGACVGKLAGQAVQLVEEVGARENEPDRCNVGTNCGNRNLSTCYSCKKTFCQHHLPLGGYLTHGGHSCTGEQHCYVNGLSLKNCKGNITTCRHCGHNYCDYHVNAMSVSFIGGHNCNHAPQWYCSVNAFCRHNCSKNDKVTICQRCGLKYCDFHSKGALLSLQGGHTCS